MADLLVIGFGNLLREDDAVGCQTAHSLQQYFQDASDVRIVAAQQLAPEMAEDVACSRFTLFLDACYGDEPGTIRLSAVLPEAGPHGFTHQLTPASLLSAALQLYGDVAEAQSLTLAGWSFNISDRLSPGAEAILPEFIRRAKTVINARRSTLTESAGLLNASR